MFCFVLRQSLNLCIPDWPGTRYIDQAGHDLLEVYLPLPPESWFSLLKVALLEGILHHCHLKSPWVRRQHFTSRAIPENASCCWSSITSLVQHLCMDLITYLHNELNIPHYKCWAFTETWDRRGQLTWRGVINFASNVSCLADLLLSKHFHLLYY